MTVDHHPQAGDAEVRAHPNDVEIMEEGIGRPGEGQIESALHLAAELVEFSGVTAPTAASASGGWMVETVVVETRVVKLRAEGLHPRQQAFFFGH